jgi:hypothetical protein
MGNGDLLAGLTVTLETVYRSVKKLQESGKSRQGVSDVIDGTLKMAL